MDILFFFFQMIFKAEFSDREDDSLGPRISSITFISPILLVDQRAMIKPFMEMSFIGDVKNSEPLPAGVRASYWFRCVRD